MNRCQRCQSTRVFSITGKCSDSAFWSFQNREKDGYAPEVKNICNDDYIETSVCLDCGQTQGEFPVEYGEAET